MTEVGRIGSGIQALKPHTGWHRDKNTTKDPRLFAERAALVFSLNALNPGPLRDAYITLRILEPSHLWGANAVKVDRDVLINRAKNWI